MFYLSLGQFWNIPITATQMSGSTYNVTIQPANGAPTRSLQGDHYITTWDGTKEPCIYLGNGQGGRSGENPNLEITRTIRWTVCLIRNISMESGKVIVLH